MERLHLKEDEERRLLRGHLWAYRNEFEQISGVSDGDAVDIYAGRTRFVGRGFYQAEGGIAARILTRHQEDLDAAFFRRRVDEARMFREHLYAASRVYRWIHGESDGLPGFVADRYGEAVSGHSSAAFYEKHAEELLDTFMAAEGVRAVRLMLNGTVYRRGEGVNPVATEFDGLRFFVDIESGQKTGAFLDQRENARVMDRLAPGMRVLDGHCYAGLWSLRAARAGAAQVLGVDTSAAAIEQANANAALNAALSCTFECADVMQVLERKETWDIVLLDPPPLAKSRAQANKALGVYQSLNRAAMRAIAPGGYLVTSSCSHAVDLPSFMETIKRAARSAQRQAWILETRGASPDHPVLMAMPETEYLHCVALRIF